MDWAVWKSLGNDEQRALLDKLVWAGHAERYPNGCPSGCEECTVRLTTRPSLARHYQ